LPNQGEGQPKPLAGHTDGRFCHPDPRVGLPPLRNVRSPPRRRRPALPGSAPTRTLPRGRPLTVAGDGRRRPRALTRPSHAAPGAGAAGGLLWPARQSLSRRSSPAGRPT